MSLNIYILAGGKSSRMGQDKGLLQMQDKPIVQHLIETVKPLSDKIWIITENEDYLSMGIPLLKDTLPNIGPAGGIDTILQHSTARQNLILSCDMPFVVSDALEVFLKQDPSNITIAKLHGYPEVFPGIYPSHCAALWRTTVLSGVYKMSELISKFPTTFVSGEKIMEQYPHFFVNMNTPTEFEQALRWKK
ncbi:MAG: molybdenum cofactor guanylyltransferase [Chitinophagaceae bacterium]|nr:molybdenum cofactor guanylyltransferase [Chitinophagaceae bacterium]